jgi:hypothetical protein
MVRTYVNVEHMLSTVKKVERILGGLGKTPFEPLKEEQQEGMYNDIMLEK